MESTWRKQRRQKNKVGHDKKRKQVVRGAQFLATTSRYLRSSEAWKITLFAPDKLGILMQFLSPLSAKR